MMTINVKFIGTLRHITGKSNMLINFSTDFSVKNLIQKIALDIPEIKTALNQQPDGTIKTNILILVNNREISVLNGIDTLITNGDEVVLIPITHGG